MDWGGWQYHWTYYTWPHNFTSKYDPGEEMGRNMHNPIERGAIQSSVCPQGTKIHLHKSKPGRGWGGWEDLSDKYFKVMPLTQKMRQKRAFSWGKITLNLGENFKERSTGDGLKSSPARPDRIPTRLLSARCPQWPQMEGGQGPGRKGRDSRESRCEGAPWGPEVLWPRSCWRWKPSTWPLHNAAQPSPNRRPTSGLRPRCTSASGLRLCPAPSETVTFHGSTLGRCCAEKAGAGRLAKEALQGKRTRGVFVFF